MAPSSWKSREISQKEYVAAADSVARDWQNLGSLQSNLHDDAELVFCALQQSGNALRFAGPKCKANRALVTFAVQRDGLALQYAADELKSDLEIVLAAVRENGNALRFAALQLRGAQSVVRAAVENSGWAFYCAADGLKSDRELISGEAHKLSKAADDASTEVGIDADDAVARRRFWWLIQSRCFMVRHQIGRIIGARKHFVDYAIMIYPSVFSYSSSKVAGSSPIEARYVTHVGPGLLIFATGNIHQDDVLAIIRNRLGLFLLISGGFQHDFAHVLDWSSGYHQVLGRRRMAVEDSQAVQLPMQPDGDSFSSLSQSELEASISALEAACLKIQHAVHNYMFSVSEHNTAFRFASRDILNDREFMLPVVWRSGWILEFASEALQEDREIVVAAVHGWPAALQFAGELMRNDREIVLQALEELPFAFAFASDALKNDPALALAAVKKDAAMFSMASDELRSNPDFIVQVISETMDRDRIIQQVIAEFQHTATETILDSETVVFSDVQESIIRQMLQVTGRVLIYLPEEWKLERSTVLRALEKNREILEFLPEHFKNDREVVLLAASMHDSFAVLFASEELKSDQEFMLLALRKGLLAFFAAADNIKNDPNFAKVAVHLWPDLLQSFPIQLRSDRDIVLSAVSADGRLLLFASEGLQADKEVVLTAVGQNGSALQFASEPLQHDSEVISRSAGNKEHVVDVVADEPKATAPAAPVAQAETTLPEDPLPEAPSPAAPSVAPTAAPAAQLEASSPEAPSVAPTVAPATQPEPSLPEAPVPVSPSVASDSPAAAEYVSTSSSQASEPPRLRYAPMARKVRELKCEDCGKSIPAGTKWDQAAQDGGKYCQECWSTWDARCVKWVREQQESKAKELKEMQPRAAKNALDETEKQLRAYEGNQLKEQLKSQPETLMMRASEQLEKEPKSQLEEEPATERVLKVASKGEFHCPYLCGAKVSLEEYEDHRKICSKACAAIISPDDLQVEEDAQVLGRGSFGVVRRGRLNDAVEVAVKNLGVEFDSLGAKDRQSIEREIGRMRCMTELRVTDEAASRVVAVYGFLISPVQIVMELMPNGTLFQLLRGFNSLLPAQKLSMGTDIAEGMNFIHCQGIIHRDLKSANVLLDGSERCAIADFNLSAPSFSALSSAVQSSVATEVGSVAYRAPETFGFKPKYTKASDVFSYAIVAWEILTGDIPYAELSNDDIRSGVKSGERLELPDELKAIEGLVLYELVPECWAHDPLMRPRFDEIFGRCKQPYFWGS